jgi:flagellar biosynthesis/type III secretory pathway M-ring protein FliF/YscJ
MMPIIMRQTHYWALAACFVLIAILSQLNNRTPTYTYQETARPSAQTDIQRAKIEHTVSGAIGIDQTRGDAVFVVVKQ